MSEIAEASPLAAANRPSSVTLGESLRRTPLPYAFLRSLLTTLLASSLVIVGILPACAGGGGGGPPSPGGGSGGNGGSAADGGLGATGAGLCLLNNCNSDAECEGCSFGRTECDLAENRCVACNASTGQGCLAGEQCTSFGTCAPVGATCPTDSTGSPTITCTQDKDCFACDPLHQKCDTATSKCVACTADDKSHCLGSDKCAAGKCETKCPANCTTDGDCGACENGGKQAFACHNHVCAECSATKPCGAGLECQKGQCVKPCGLAGSPTAGGGECKTDAECYGCGNSEGQEKWVCKFPINGGAHGTCVAPAQGCTDLLSSGAVLPPPYDKVTNTCSTDGNCQNVSLDLNVGKLIRDLVGSNEINLGLKKVKINDAVLKYPMAACASVKLMSEIDCGVCVPCKSDADCKPIDLDPLIGDLFKGDPLAQLAASFLMDLLYGKDKKHEIHMQCLPVAQGYGVCAPCSNPAKACGAGSTGGQTGSGKCEHSVCETGSALDPTCGLCAAQVCLEDFYCCLVEWDQQCIDKANQVCATTCDGQTNCDSHTPCELGAPLHRSCSPCVEKVCGQDPFCCNLKNGNWDQQCVDHASAFAQDCAGECAGSSSCVHNECEVGSKLTKQCSTCADKVCTNDPYCCEGEWDWLCAKAAKGHAECGCPPDP